MVNNNKNENHDDSQSNFKNDKRRFERKTYKALSVAALVFAAESEVKEFEFGLNSDESISLEAEMAALDEKSAAIIEDYENDVVIYGSYGQDADKEWGLSPVALPSSFAEVSGMLDELKQKLPAGSLDRLLGSYGYTEEDLDQMHKSAATKDDGPGSVLS